MRQIVRILKDVPEMKLVKRKIGPLVTGDEVELWAWDAAILKRQGMAEILQVPSVPEIRKLIMAEERSLELLPLPENFYYSVALNLSTLLSEDKREEANELRAQTFSLLETRLSKLVKLALSPEVPAGLTPEEHFLVNNVAGGVENWTRRLKESFGFKEEVGKNERGWSVRHAAGDEADIQKQGVPAAELHAGGTTT